MESAMELAPQSAADQPYATTRKWLRIRPEHAQQLTEARLQFHYAAQFATCGGLSFLPAQPDDSHTNLEWIPEFQALFSRLIPAKKPFRIGARPAELALLLVPEPRSTVAECKLNRCTIAEATDWLGSEIGSQGVDAERYSLKRHYDIPPHPVADGGAFDASDRDSFDELSKWFSNGFAVLNDLARSIPASSEVRCWPHHFDVGMLISVDTNRSIGVGLEPGDDYYGEPYFYVNMNPQPSADDVRLLSLAGKGSWHSSEWVGAVLQGSRLDSSSNQEAQVRAFFDSAIGAARQVIVRN